MTQKLTIYFASDWKLEFEGCSYELDRVNQILYIYIENGRHYVIPLSSIKYLIIERVK